MNFSANNREPKRRRAPPTTARFTRFLRAVTLFTLPPVAIALVELGRTIGPLLATTLTLLLLTGLLYGIGPRVQAGFNDVERPRWVGSLAMPLFDTAWCAALLSPVTTGLFCVLVLPVAFVRSSAHSQTFSPSGEGGLAPCHSRAISLHVIPGNCVSGSQPGSPSATRRYESLNAHPLGLASIAQAGSALALLWSTYGVWIRRRWVRVRRVDVEVAGLPESLSGYRIAHLNDLHIGSIDRFNAAKSWVALANALEADLVAVTGDLVSTGSAFHDEVVALLGALRGRDGVFACLGNHDYYSEASLCARLAQHGVRVLRNEGIVSTGAVDRADIFIAGVEDLWRGKPDLSRALETRPKGMPTVLLAHNPDFFPNAVREKIELTLSGHVHAGQVAVPFFSDRFSLGRFATKWPAGLFKEGISHLFVSAGLGTTGPAIRIGAAPEIVEIVLRRSAPPSPT
ncbi:MAG: hypothetical protein NVS3B20_20260 [Polyangiales bacterium]